MTMSRAVSDIGGAPRRAPRRSRPVSASGARFTLLNVLGELVRPAHEPAWTSALLDVLGRCGFEQAAARQAIARTAAAGWIAREQVGRDVRWRLTADGLALVEDGIRRVEALRAAPARWDGRWLVVLVSIPHVHRHTRGRLYRSLRWAGFGNPAPNVWITPHLERAAGLARTVGRLGLDGSTVSFAGAAAAVGMSEKEMVARAWDLDELARDYTELTRAFARRRPRSPAAALHALLELDAALQRLPYRDPVLPAQLLPGWPGRRHATRLLDRRAAWLPGAQREWASIVASRACNAQAGRSTRHNETTEAHR
jgi:phenylacetic acid degradation operon negative regulatory protein